MTDDKIALREPLEKGSDATFLREMIGFAAGRLRALETDDLCAVGLWWIGEVGGRGLCRVGEQPPLTPEARRGTWQEVEAIWRELMQ